MLELQGRVERPRGSFPIIRVLLLESSQVQFND
jgi:hypothetical protein